MENKIIKVSIIIPVYNVSEYLRECLESVINQSLKEIQIIIVNDASPDPLDDKICQEYIRSDNRIKYIKHPENKGLGAARNTALLHVKGAFVTFVDSDDFIHKDMCKVLYEKAVANDCDLVQCNFTRVDTNSRIIKNALANQNEESILLKELDSKLHILNGGSKKYFIGEMACAKLIKRYVAKNIKFPENRLHEDQPYFFYLIFHTKQILLSTEKFYYYRINPKSIVSNYSKKNELNIIKNLEEMKYFLDQRQLSSENKKAAEKYIYGVFIWLILKNVSKYKFSIPFVILTENFIPLKVKLILIIRGVLQTLKLHDIVSFVYQKIKRVSKN